MSVQQTPFAILASSSPVFFFIWFFFFNDTATTEIYTLSLHDALPISSGLPSTERKSFCGGSPLRTFLAGSGCSGILGDRKSTRLNSSHLVISYAVFCLKKKKPNVPPTRL